MEVILHIGTDKTGSTSIQRHLAVNTEWFLANSVYIPQTGFGAYNGHSALLSTLEAEGLDELSSELQGAKTTGYKYALLSWEGMNFFRSFQISRLHKAIRKYPVTIVVYLREQADLIQTGVLQQLKTNKHNTHLHVFDRGEVVAEGPAGDTTFYSKNRDYYERLKKWKKAIPRARFNIAVFSRQSLLNGDVVCDFLDRIGLGIDDDFQREDRELNQSLDVESAMLVEDWQSQSLPADTIARLIDIARSVIRLDGGGAKYFLSESSVTALREAYAQANRKLGRKLMGISGSPFTELRSCWREEPFQDMLQRSSSLQQKIQEIDCTPTLRKTIPAENISRDLCLTEGWCNQEKWGVWSRGERSGIRFRLMHRSLRYDVAAVQIVVHGLYHGDNETTHVTINGIDFGEQRLLPSHPGMEVPVSALLPYEVVDIVLQHKAPAGPRTVAFGLKKVGRKLVRSNVA